MKYLIILLMCCSCSTPPNLDIGFTDGPEQAKFAFMMTGNDFTVDMKGNNYTLHGQNLNYNQVRNLFFMISPWSYAELKKFVLNLCHSNKVKCNYTQTVNSIAQIEEKMKASMNYEQRVLFEKILLE